MEIVYFVLSNRNYIFKYSPILADILNLNTNSRETYVNKSTTGLSFQVFFDIKLYN